MFSPKKAVVSSTEVIMLTFSKPYILALLLFKPRPVKVYTYIPRPKVLSHIDSHLGPGPWPSLLCVTPTTTHTCIGFSTTSVPINCCGTVKILLTLVSPMKKPSVSDQFVGSALMDQQNRPVQTTYASTVLCLHGLVKDSSWTPSPVFTRLSEDTNIVTLCVTSPRK